MFFDFKKKPAGKSGIRILAGLIFIQIPITQKFSTQFMMFQFWNRGQIGQRFRETGSEFCLDFPPLTEIISFRYIIDTLISLIVSNSQIMQAIGFNRNVCLNAYFLRDGIGVQFFQMTRHQRYNFISSRAADGGIKFWKVSTRFWERL